MSKLLDLGKKQLGVLSVILAVVFQGGIVYNKVENVEKRLECLEERMFQHSTYSCTDKFEDKPAPILVCKSNMEVVMR